MAGHSKWANIKYRKERADQQKGKAFSRVAKEIISAVKLGGPDPKGNPRLRLAIQKAKTVNMPNENVERNIKKASSPDQEDYAAFSYEIYGYGGVGIIVEGMTDNRNRTASDMRIAINKRGGSLATPGAVNFNFDRRGVIQVSKDQGDEDKIFQAAIESGALDFEVAEDGYMVLTDPTDLYAVKEKLEELGIQSKEADIEMISKSVITCDDEMRKSNLALIEWIENIDDVDVVYHNMDMGE